MEGNQRVNKSVLAGKLNDFDCELSVDQVLQRVFDKQHFRDRIALISGQVQLNFAQLEIRACHLADQLLKHIQERNNDANHGEDRIIAVCVKPSCDLIVALLAIWKIGAAYLPIDPAFPINRVLHILNETKPNIFLTCKSLLEDSGWNSIIQGDLVFNYDDISFEQAKQYEKRQFPSSDPKSTGRNLAVVLYTSGSSGVPKGVRLTHRNIMNRIYWQWKTFPFQTTEMACFKTALTFVDSIAEIWAPLLAGISIVIVPKTVTQNPELFVTILETYQVTRLVLVPSLLTSMLTYINTRANSQKRLLHSLRLWVCSGEVLSEHVLRQFYDYFGDGYQICNFYGSTEIMGDVAYINFHSHSQVQASLLKNKVPIGRPLDNCSIYLLNASKELVDKGDIGEIYVAGSHVADGYINKKETTSFIVNVIDNRKGYEVMYKTGDYGRIVQDMLYYEGRADSQIKVRGHRIDLTEINNALNQLDQVSKGIALCYKPGEPEQEIIAFVVPHESSASSIQQGLKRKLISYAMPRVVEVEDIPLLVNGKIDRQILLKSYANDLKRTFTANIWNENELNELNPEEREIAKVVFKTIVSVIGGSARQKIGLMDNYFYVGGNSLNAVIVVTKLRDLGFELDLNDFLEAGNFYEIISKMASNQLADCSKIGLSFKLETLNASVKDDVIRIICECFSQKGDLELLTGVTYEDYHALMPDLWDPILAANLSFTVKNRLGQVMAVGLHCDAFEVPALKTTAKRLSYVFDVLEYVKGPVREALVDKKKRNVLQNFLVATDSSLSAAENVALVQFVEKETIKLAKSRGFKSIFTSNSSPLTQQICNDVLGYKILSEYQVNQFVASDGTRPFALAADNQYITVSIKHI